MKTFKDYVTDVESLTESIVGKASVEYDGKNVTNVEGKIVLRTEGGAPNIEAILSFSSGKLNVMYNVSKGYFEDKRFAKKFMVDVKQLIDKIDDLETVLYTARNEGAISKAFASIGVKNVAVNKT